MTASPDPATSPAQRSAAATPRPAFRERLWLGPLGWGGLVAFAAVLGVALVPVDELLAIVVGVLALLGGLAAAVLTTPLVEVERGTLRAGPAHIPVRLLAQPRVLDRAALREQMGPAFDARAFACLRAWIGTAVRVEVRDPQDPTPYWIISTRRPDALVAALGGLQLYAPGVARTLALDVLGGGTWDRPVALANVAGTSGTTLTVGVLLLTAGVVLALARRHGVRLGAFRERNRTA